MRRRIMLLVVGMTALVVLAFAVPVAILIRQEVTTRGKQATTEQAARVGLYLRAGNRTKPVIASYVSSISKSSGRPTSVICPDGSMLGTLPAAAGPVRAPGKADDPDSGLGGPAGAGGAGDGGNGGGGPQGASPQLTQLSHGVLAEVHAGYGGNGYLVRVYASDTTLHSGETGWWLLLAGASVGMLLVAAGAAELLTRRIVRPLVHTAETARQLSAGETTARAPTDGPREIGEVGVALNRLADRIDELIAEERETVADLSHRLRTPLTAMRLDAEALRDKDDAQRMGDHAGALERMLTAVIHAARRPEREGRMPACDAIEVVGEGVRFWSALADDQNRETTVDLPTGPLPVRCAAEDLAAALNALLENVIAHTPDGTPFAVSLRAEPGGARLEVSDAGPGLPADALVRGRSDRGSSGLGLDIARRCAEAGGGSISIDTGPTGGARIVMHLRAP